MPTPVSEASWWGSLIWLLVVTGAAFGVAWLSGTRPRIRRAWYIPLLLAVTGGLSAGHLAWLGVGEREVLTTRWAWGLLAAAIVPLLLAEMPPHERPVAPSVTEPHLAREAA